MALKIGELTLDIDANTDGLKRALAQLKKLTDLVDSVANTNVRAAKVQALALAKQESGTKRAFVSALKLQQQMQNAGVPTKHIDAVGRSIEQLATTMSNGKLSVVEHTRALDDFKIMLSRNERGLMAFKAQQVAAAKAQRETAQEVNQALAIETKARREANKAIKEHEDALNRQRAAVFRAQQATQDQKVRIASKGRTNDLDVEADRNLARYIQRMQSGVLTQQQFVASNRQFMGSFKDLNRELSRTKNLDSMGRLFGQMASASVLAAGPLSGFGSRMRALSSIAHNTTIEMVAAVTGVTTLAAGFALLTVASIKTSLRMERIQAMMRSVSGSTLGAASSFKFAQEMAHKYALDLTTLTQGYGQMMAAAEGTSLEGQKLRGVFESLVQASAALNLSALQQERVFYAVQQMMSKGVVSSEELRGQLGDQLYGAFQKAAEAMKVTTSELIDMMRKGELLTEEFLIPFSKILSRDFAEGAANNVNTLSGKIQNLTTTLTETQLEFARVTGTAVKFKAILDAMSEVLNYFKNNMVGSISVVAGLGGALIALNLPRIIKAFWDLSKAVLGVKTAMAALNFIAGNTPWGRIATAIAMAGVATLGFVVGQEAMKKALADTNDEFKRLVEVAQGYMDVSSAQRTAMGPDREQYIQDAAKHLKAINTVRAALLARDKVLAEGPKVSTKVDQFSTPLDMAKIDPKDQAKYLEERKQNMARIVALAKQEEQIRKDIIRVAMAPAEENPFTAPPQDAAKKSKSKGADPLADYKRTLKDIQDMHREIETQQEGLRMFDQGVSGALDFADALSEANRMLEGLDQAELKNISKELSTMGFATGDVNAQLAKLILHQKKIAEQTEAARKAAEDAKKKEKFLEETNYELATMQQRLKAMRQGGRALEEFDESADRAEAMRQLNSAAMEHNITLEDRLRLTNAMGESMKALTEEAKRMAVAQELASGLTSVFEDLIFNLDDATSSLKNFFDEIIRMATRKAVLEPLEELFATLFQGMGQKMIGGDGILSNIMGRFGLSSGGHIDTTAIGQSQAGYTNLSSFTPGLAKGGTMLSGVPTLVGEEGPELVRARKNMHVTPNNELGGNVEWTINVNNTSGANVTPKVNPDTRTIDFMIEAGLANRIQSGASSRLTGLQPALTPR